MFEPRVPLFCPHCHRLGQAQVLGIALENGKDSPALRCLECHTVFGIELNEVEDLWESPSERTDPLTPEPLT